MFDNWKWHKEECWLVKFRKLKRILNKNYNILWDQDKGKGSHGSFVGLSRKSRTRETYPIPHKHQQDVPNVYVNALRRAFELTEKDGVKDDLFK